MSDRPLTIIFISVAILVALYLRRLRPGGYQQIQSFIGGEVYGGTPEHLTPSQARAEGAKRGVNVTLTQPITREAFDRLIGGG